MIMFLVHHLSFVLVKTKRQYYQKERKNRVASMPRANLVRDVKNRVFISTIRAYKLISKNIS